MPWIIIGGSFAGLLVLALTWIVARRRGTTITSPDETPSSVHKPGDELPSVSVYELQTRLSIYELPHSNELIELPTPANCMVRPVATLWI